MNHHDTPHCVPHCGCMLLHCGCHSGYYKCNITINILNIILNNSDICCHMPACMRMICVQRETVTVTLCLLPQNGRTDGARKGGMKGEREGGREGGMRLV